MGIQNIPALVAAAIVVIRGFIGMGRGIVKSVFATFSLVVAIVLALQVMPYGTKFLKETSVYTTINETVSGTVNYKIQMSVDDGVSSQMDAIDEMKLPKFLKDLLKTNNNDEMYEALGITRFTEYISTYITCLILNGISLLVSFIVIFIVLKLLGCCLDMLSKVPVVRGLNRIGGLCFGLINGVGLLWLACIVITVFSGTRWGQYLFEQINNSTFLSFIYNNNYLLALLANMSKVLF